MATNPTPPTTPDLDTTDDPVVMETDFEQLMLDVIGSMRATTLLMSVAQFDYDLQGFSVLLEGLHGRLQCANDGLVQTAMKLGFPVLATLGTDAANS